MYGITFNYPELGRQLLNEKQEAAQQDFKAWALKYHLTEEAVIELSDIIVTLMDVSGKQGIIAGIDIGKSAIQF